MTLKSIIVEDEPAAANLLKTLLRSHFPNVCVLAEAADVREAIERIGLLQPDLVFLDIELRDGTVFDALDQLKTFRGHLVFTTGHNEFALRAFRYNAIDYLLKPIGPDMLREVMGRLEGRDQQHQMRYDLLRESVASQKFEKIVLSIAEAHRVVPLDDIVRLEGDGNYTHVFLASGENIMTSKPLKFFEETLPEEQFFRLHQSHMVQLRYVRILGKGDDQHLEMDNGDRVPVARRKRDAFVGWLAAR